MSHDVHEVYAVQYGYHARRASENHVFGDPHDAPEPLAYFVWLIRGPHGAIVVDTGFDQHMATRRGRTLLHPVGEPIVCRSHAGEHGVATDRRHFLGDQYRRHRRLGAERLVGVPDVGAEGRRLVVVAELDENGRILRGRRKRMHGQFVEAAAEIHQVIR